MKILLNAEAFGFGPSAVIASIFPQLNQCSVIKQIDYIGEKHTLDLQRKLNYQQIFEVSEENTFKEIVSQYDVFLTALDFEKAQWAIEMNTPTIIYDSLCWYWRKLHPAIFQCDYYLAQDFYRVSERLEQMAIEHYELIPPLVEHQDIALQNISEKNSFVLINFGGLENPLWDSCITIQYMDNILNVLLPYFQKQNIDYKIACNTKHAKYFEQYGAQNYSYQDMQSLVKKSSFIYATSGLGNIYECSQYHKKCLFLPAVNDSQGQQITILYKLGLVDSFIDWSDLGFNINYKEQQKIVLRQIEKAIENFDSTLFFEKLISLQSKYNYQLPCIIQKLGNNGKDVLIYKIISYIEHISKGKKEIYYD